MSPCKSASTTLGFRVKSAPASKSCSATTCSAATIHLAFGKRDVYYNDRILAQFAPDYDRMGLIYRGLRAFSRQAAGGHGNGAVDESGFFTLSNEDLIAACPPTDMRFTLMPGAASFALSAFSELGLVDVRTECSHDGSSVRRVRLREVQGKVNLDDSVLYCEGRVEAEEFKRFSDWILNATPEELRARIVRPIMPDGNSEVLVEKTSYLDDAAAEKLKRAYEYASTAHKGVKRKSGEPYIIHPIEVALILSDLRMDVDTLCAALLHDTIEDTDTTAAALEEQFGAQVSQLVQGVTKITRIEVESLTDEQAATMRKMFVAMSKDIRVIVIKLADRLHNMRTLSALKEDRRIFKSRETLEIYAPIAHRLGIGSIKWELEDLAFYYLEPAKFKQISRLVAESRNERETYLASVIETLNTELARVGIADAHIDGRPKHLYSIYQKMTKRGKGFSEIYDLIAVRVIVKTVGDCYSVLGAVHTLWHPMPGRFKDYIAMPKLNMYQSLHTTVIGPAARPLEVQIRTEEMHRMSEYGVAAHWRYKEKGSKADAAFDRQIAWLRQMVDWQEETKDSREFLNELKVDLAPTEVFVRWCEGKRVHCAAFL